MVFFKYLIAAKEIKCSDPKGCLYEYNKKCSVKEDPRVGVRKADPSMQRKTGI